MAQHVFNARTAFTVHLAKSNVMKARVGQTLQSVANRKDTFRSVPTVGIHGGEFLFAFIVFAVLSNLVQLEHLV